MVTVAEFRAEFNQRLDSIVEERLRVSGYTTALERYTELENVKKGLPELVKAVSKEIEQALPRLDPEGYRNVIDITFRRINGRIGSQKLTITKEDIDVAAQATRTLIAQNEKKKITY